MKKRSIITPIIVVLFLGLLFAFFLFTRPGLQLIFLFEKPKLANYGITVQLADIEGNLFDCELPKIVWNVKGTKFQFDKVHLNWSLGSLWHRPMFFDVNAQKISLAKTPVNLFNDFSGKISYQNSLWQLKPASLMAGKQKVGFTASYNVSKDNFAVKAAISQAKKENGMLSIFGSLSQYMLLGHWKGDHSGFDFRAHGNATSFTTDKLKIDLYSGSLTGSINSKWENAVSWNANLVGKNIRFSAKQSLMNLAVKAKGDEKNQSYDVDVQSGSSKCHLLYKRTKDKSWLDTIAALSFNSTVGAWRLNDPVVLDFINKKSIPFVLTDQSKHQLKGFIENKNDRWQLWAKVTHFDLSHLLFLFPGVKAKGYLSGYVQLYFNKAKQLIFTGDLKIPQADINATDYISSGAGFNDLVFVDDNNKVINKQQRLSWKSDLKIDFGKKVKFKGFHVKTQVEGYLDIYSGSGFDSYAKGRLDLLQGEYSIYGKVFKLTKGMLIFAHSSLNDPALNITAQYQMDNPKMITNDVTADQLILGVHIFGTALRSTVQLYSEPSMSQGDVLSYMVLGEPISKVNSSNQLQLLSKAALEMALKSGKGSVLGQIQKQLGAKISFGSMKDDGWNSDVSADNSPDSSHGSPLMDEDTAVFIGKKFSPRVTLSYGVGLFNHEQQLNADFKIDRHWHLLTQNSNQNSGMDLLYVLNR